MRKLLVFLPFVFAFISCQELPPEAYFIDKYKITGTININPKIKDKCSGTLFIIVRKGTSIQPLAVKKKTKYDFPVQFSISPADVLMPQRANEFVDELILMARISKSGNPMPQKGDCESSVISVNAGDRNIKLLINRVKE